MQNEISRFFDRLDVDDSASVSAADFQRTASQVIAATGLASDSEQARAVQAAYQRLWDQVFAQMDTDGDGEINIFEFEDGVTKAEFDSGPGFLVAVEPIAEAVLDAYDTSHNGALSQDEVVAWLAAFGISAADARQRWHELDVDASGVVSRAELIEAIRLHYTHPGSSPLGDWILDTPQPAQPSGGLTARFASRRYRNAPTPTTESDLADNPEPQDM